MSLSRSPRLTNSTPPDLRTATVRLATHHAPKGRRRCSSRAARPGAAAISIPAITCRDRAHRPSRSGSAEVRRAEDAAFSSRPPCAGDRHGCLQRSPCETGPRAPGRWRQLARRRSDLRLVDRHADGTAARPRRLNELRAKSGLDWLRLHDLRHAWPPTCSRAASNLGPSWRSSGTRPSA